MRRRAGQQGSSISFGWAHEGLLELFPFRWNRNGALDSCFDAFSSREPVSTSLENALEHFPIWRNRKGFPSGANRDSP
ncbi:hypothetical protein XH93_18920 [Bradyrhizobium sp. CCBAU 51753]|nr:hypothetical protein XH93_18920 [Bradyrhizobium sp. CCBAU 51753]